MRGLLGTRDHKRDADIMRVIQSCGPEMWIGDICVTMGFSFPTGLEVIRPNLNRLVEEGKLTKAVRPTHETRRAYYALTPAVRPPVENTEPGA